MAFNVLIVDDSSTMRKIIRRILRLSGFPVGVCHEAADGAEALALLRREPVDVAIVDVNMPNMNGEEFLEHIEQEVAQQSLAVLVVSSDRSQGRIDRMMALGARGYITKPFVPETLGAEMTKIVGGAQDADGSF